MAQHRTQDDQRGVVLLLALIALLLISAVGAAILFMAAGESTIVGSQRLTARAFYAAVAGVEEGRFRLLPTNQPTGTPPLGLNYSDPLAGAVGVPVIPCTASEQAGTLVPCNTASVVAYGARPENVLYIMNSTAASPAAPASVPGTPASPTNDPFLATELPSPIVSATGSIQPGAGTANSIRYEWIRINLKTERASGQDINLDGTTADDEPIFYYQGRQYRHADLLAFDAAVLPLPWGPAPPANAGRPCAAAVCASPVYMLTAFAMIPPTSSRIVRSEVTAVPPFAMDTAVASQSPIQVSGTSRYIGYDGCDPDCVGFPPGTPPATCNTAVPLQSWSAGSGISGGASKTYPPPPCPPPSTGTGNACVQQQTGAFPYDVNELIATLRPLAMPVAPGVYTGLAMGGFPFADPINGAGADPIITYVGGDFKCTAGCSGAGILIVDGNFDFNASMEFYGIVIVRGDVTVLGGGSPTTGCNIYGALLSGGGVSTKLGGGICFHYNTCAQKNIFQNRPLLVLSFREIPD